MTASASGTSAASRALPADFPSSASPFLKSLNIQHGPVDVLGRFFLKADQAVRARGVELTLTTIDELAAFNRRFLKDSPLMPVFNPRMKGLAERPSFAILGRDHTGQIVATQAARLYDWPDTCLTEEAQSLKMFYGDEPPPIGTACQVSAPSGRAVTGRVTYSGAGWYESQYRKRELSYILPRMSRALALTQWNSDFTISFVEWVIVKKGVASRYGYTRLEPDVTAQRLFDEDEDINSALAWMPRRELIEDLEWFLEQFPAAWPHASELGPLSRKSRSAAA